jgi:hypothetical protein
MKATQSLLSILWFLGTITAAMGQTAVVNQDTTGAYVIDIVLAAKRVGDPVKMTVNLVRVKEKNEVADTTIQTWNEFPLKVDNNQPVQFHLKLDRPIEPDRAYQLRVESAGTQWAEVDLDRGLSAEISTAPGGDRGCAGGIYITLSRTPPDLDDPQAVTDANRFWTGIFDYIFGNNNRQGATGHSIYANDAPSQLVDVQISSDGRQSALGIRSITSISKPLPAAKAGEMLLCLNPATRPPQSDFNIQVKFIKPTPPVALQDPIIGEDLSGKGTVDLKDASAEPGTVGERGLERNLDLGIAYTQSRIVKNDPMTGAETIERPKRGILDVRFAPWLNILKGGYPDSTKRWFRFFTPIYLDANVATGRIVDDTVSLNRIEIGASGEYRYYHIGTQTDPNTGLTTSRTGHFTTFHRFIFKAKHDSDRDFKQDEFDVSAEYQPIFAAWNHPLDANWILVNDPLTDKPVFKYSNFGWEIKPRFGFEIGKTYHRHNPAEAIKPSDTVRRFFTSLDITLNLTSHFELTATDTFYVRGEFAQNRLKNYFKAEVLAPIGNPFRETIQGVFVTFENGSQPPFNTPLVNALKVGYRIRSQGWSFSRRR